MLRPKVLTARETEVLNRLGKGSQGKVDRKQGGKVKNRENWRAGVWVEDRGEFALGLVLTGKGKSRQGRQETSYK